MICCCITFVGLVAIAIKKIVSSKKSVQPIKIQSISTQLSKNIQAIHSSRSDKQKNTFELRAVQSHSQIINVAPIHLDEQISESLDSIDMIQLRQLMNLPIEYNEFNRIDVENPGLEETPEAPNQRPYLNNQKFNSNLVSFTVLTLLFVITLIVGPIYGWHIFISSTVPQFISYRTLNT